MPISAAAGFGLALHKLRGLGCLGWKVDKVLLRLAAIC